MPSVFNRIYQQVVKRIGERPRPIQRMFWSGVSAASQKSRGGEIGRLARFEIALDNRLIFSRIRDQLGGRLRSVFCGGAQLSRDVAQLVDALGIAVNEGYGLTETSCAATLNPPDDRTPGHRRQGAPRCAHRDRPLGVR